MQRTIVIGDLHGCFDEATELLDRLAVDKADRVIFAGDLVDRGPKPRECVELAMRYECVLGNHEEKHLQQRKRKDADLSPEHLKTRRALEDVHFEYFAKLPTFIRLPEHGAVVVHAGVMPNVAIEAQDTCLTYRELDGESNQLARYLQAQGVGHALAETLLRLGEMLDGQDRGGAHAA